MSARDQLVPALPQNQWLMLRSRAGTTHIAMTESSRTVYLLDDPFRIPICHRPFDLATSVDMRGTAQDPVADVGAQEACPTIKGMDPA